MHLLLLVIIIAVTFLSSAVSDAVGMERARMYNEAAIGALKEENFDGAISYFREALASAAQDETIKKNLSTAYFKKAESDYAARRLDSAEENLLSSLEFNPDNVSSLILMGDIKYFSQELDEAKEFWKRAFEVEPQGPFATKVIERIKRLEKESKVESEYKPLTMDIFDIRYPPEGGEDLGYDIRYYLQSAYSSVGRDLDHYPQHKIVVLIYAKKDFENFEHWRTGRIGVYDGKIRLSLLDEKFTPDEIRAIVSHEYTHAVIHDIALANCPIWLNEGLAKYEEFEHTDKELFVLRNAVDEDKVIPLKELDNAFKNPKGATHLQLAYEESYSMAKFLIDRYSLYSVRKILESFKEGQGLERVFQRWLNIGVAEFERRWLEDLKSGALY